MSGSFAGSKSLDDRRRRRIATEEKHITPASSSASAEKPLPARRPTGRFPLRRLISRSPWKLTGVCLMALAACVAGLLAGQSTTIASGTYGPGLAALCDASTGRLTTALGGLLLLASGQLAWLIRWARARSLRDFRGRYRVWWWASLALTLAGVTLLTDAQIAFAATVVWLTERTPFGSDLLFQLLPAVAAVTVLLPALQADMRNCRTSRALILLAAALWTAAGTALFFPDHLAAGIRSLNWPVPVATATTGAALIGTAMLFAALLFHARHVVYESVEPPELPRRKKKPATATVDVADHKTEPKQSSRRSSRTKTASKTKTSSRNSTKPEPAVEVAAKSPIESKPQPEQRVEPASRPAAAASKSSPSRMDDQSDKQDGPSAGNGRQHRLDEPHDALKGLSKRERRKQRKLMRDRERSGL